MAKDWSNAASIDPTKNSPGYFKARLCKGGPIVGAKMWITEGKNGEPIYHATIDDRWTDPHSPRNWPWEKISQDEYVKLITKADLARQFYPESPEANPDRPINQSTRRLS